MKKPKNQKITEAMWIRIPSDDLYTVGLKSCHKILALWKQYSVQKKKQGRQVISLPQIPNFEDLPLLYTEPVLIKSEKNKILLKCVNFYLMDMDTGSFICLYFKRINNMRSS